MAVPSASPPAPTVGVLFVHGIGEQLQGETLVHYADALACWYTRWLSKGEEIEPGEWAEASVSVRKTELEPGDSASADTVVTITGDVNRRWLLAESWWADVFRPPKTRTLLRWMLTVLPYMLLEQFWAPLDRALDMRQQRFSRPWVSALRIVAFGAMFVVSLALGGVGLVLLLVLLVPFVLPSEKLQSVAKTVSLKLANTLGDAFILTSSPTQFDAMARRVADDLMRLDKKVTKVIVVAHSQGTAVAHEAIRRYPPKAALSSFVTLGQAIGKLQRAQTLRRTPESFVM